MLFEKAPPLNLLICSRCKSTGFAGLGRCPECRGMAMGVKTRGRWLYWDFPLTRYHLSLAKGRRILNKIRVITVLLAGLNFWFWLGWSIYQHTSYRFLLNLELKGWGDFYNHLTRGDLFSFRYRDWETN